MTFQLSADENEGASGVKADEGDTQGGPKVDIASKLAVLTKDLTYYTKYIGEGIYPAELEQKVRVVQDDDEGFPGTIPIWFSLNMQPSGSSSVVRMNWRAKVTDYLAMDWNSDFIRDLSRPEIEFTRSWTVEGKVGGEFPYVEATGAETHSVTSHPTKPFVIEYGSNGFTCKTLAMKRAPHVCATTEWANMSFETRIIQMELRPRGLISTCQGVYEQIKTKSVLTIGTGYVVMTEISIPEITTRAVRDSRSLHGSTFTVTSEVEDADGNPMVTGKDEGGWLKRLIRRLSGPSDRWAEQQITRYDVGNPISTIRAASPVTSRRGGPMSSLQWYRDTITKGP